VNQFFSEFSRLEWTVGEGMQKEEGPGKVQDALENIEFLVSFSYKEAVIRRINQKM